MRHWLARVLVTLGVVALAVTGSAATASAARPRFTSTITAATSAPARENIGRYWHAGCPVPLSQLRRVTASYYGFDGRVHKGDIIVNASIATRTQKLFKALFTAKFRIYRLDATYPSTPALAQLAGASTVAFNCRPVRGSTVLSQHAYGLAIDINPVQNPEVVGGKPLNSRSWQYMNRSRYQRGMVMSRGVVVRAMAAQGLRWGGNWTSKKDYMHFSTNGR